MKPLSPSKLNGSAVPAGDRSVPGAGGGPRAGGPAITLLFVSALTILAATAISPALPAIEATFATSENAALLTRLLITMPALVIAIVAPVAGSLADRFGRSRVLICAIVLYGFAGLSGLVLDSLYSLLIGRAFLGAAVAGIMTASTALVGDLFSGAERDRFMGWQAAFIGIGGLLFMTVGGLLAEASWRMPFAIYGVAFIVLPAAMVYLPDTNRGERPTGPGGLAKVPWLAVAVLYLAAAFNSVIFYLIPTQLPFYLHSLGVNAPSLIGVTIGVFTLSSAVASLAYGNVRQRVPLLGMFALGFSLMAAGYHVMASAASHSLVLAGLVITGVGMSGIMPSLMAGAMSVAPPSLRGRISGGLTASIFFGQFLSPLVSQFWIERFGYQVTLRNMGAALAAAALMALVVLVLSKRGHPEEGVN